MASNRGAAGISAAVLAVGMLMVPVSASAAVPTEIAFVDPAPLTKDFGGDWLIQLTVQTRYDATTVAKLTATEGTVDVYLSGIAGAYAATLPIQADGTVYFSQPSAKTLLAAGEYDVSAIFNPAPGGYYSSSQTVAPLKLTIAALGVAPHVEVSYDASVSSYPVITASLGGAYVDASGGAPAGTWGFVVTASGADAVFTQEVAQAEGSTEPLRVEVTSRLAKGEEYSLASTFTPAAELAGGLTVPGIPAATFQTPAGTFGESFSASVPLPLWLIILLGVLLVGLIVAAIILGVRLSRQAPQDEELATAGDRRTPGDPTNVEIVGLEDLGLPEPATIPEMLPPGAPTTKIPQLPESTTWLLSDVEPAVGAPTVDLADAPTERIGTLDVAEPQTEGNNTSDAAEADNTVQNDKPSNP